MLYIRLLLFILLVLFLLSSGIFLVYESIAYQNLLYIIIPIFLMIGLYLYQYFFASQAYNLGIFRLVLNPNIAITLMLISVAFSLKDFDINSFLMGNYAEIRSGFLNKLEEGNVGLLQQLVPILSIYPFIYLLYSLQNLQKVNAISIILIIGLLIIGQTTGGRQIIFQLLILLTYILGKQFLFTKKGLIFSAILVAVGAWVTLGRFDNPEVNKAQFIEALTPARFNDFLLDNSSNKALNDIIIETSFYFSQSVPAFCNEIKNLDISFYPNYPLGMQPFLERQLYKIGVGSTSQVERFNDFLALTDNSGFFSGTWATGFLDVYYNLGYFGGFFFFLIISVILFQCDKGLKSRYHNKFRILTAFNILFVITTFMAPAIFDTLMFFTYLIIFISNPSNENKEQLE